MRRNNSESIIIALIVLVICGTVASCYMLSRGDVQTTERVTVTFETNGGTSIDPIRVKKGGALTLPEEPTKDGYSFGGWYVDVSLNSKLGASLAKNIASDITLYAKWNELPPHVHTLAETSHADPDCTNAGYTIESCTDPDCDYFERTDAPALGHDEGTVVTDKAATCLEGGTWHRECTACGTELENGTIDALGHDMESHPGQAPTCAVDGWYEYESCRREGCTESTYTVNPATGAHSYADGECTVCGGKDTRGTAGLNMRYNQYAKTYSVIGYSGEDTEVIIPWYYNDGTHGVHIVDKIAGDGVFKNNTSITSVTIPGGVTEIAKETMYGCSNLDTIVIPDSVVLIGKDALKNTAWLESQDDGVVYAGKVLYTYKGTMPANTTLTVAPGTRAIGDYAFKGKGSNLVGVTFPSSLVRIGMYAFYNAGLQGQLVIPDSVTEISHNAFYYCLGITSVAMGSGVKAIRSYAFYNCNNIAGVYITDLAGWCQIDFASNGANPLSISSSVGGHLYLNGTEITELTIPEGVTYIGVRAFAEMKELTSVTFGSTVREIDDRAFFGCTKLNNITLPSSVKSIGVGAFSSCKALTDLEIGSGVTYIGWDAFSGTGITSLVVPGNVKYIDGSAFESCKSLTTVTIEDGVEYIGNSAFDGCTLLSDITMSDSVEYMGLAVLDNTAWYASQPDGVIYIGKILYEIKGTYSSETLEVEPGTKAIAGYAVNGRSNITTVVLPEGLKSIGGWAFGYLYNLTELVMPDSLERIGNNAFASCTSLADITFSQNLTYIDQEVFDNTAWYNNQGDGLVYAGNVVYKYKGAVPESGTVELREGTLGIAGKAFLGTQIKSLVIPDTVKYIGTYAFANCRDITEITLGSGLEEISRFAFNGSAITTFAYNGTAEEWENIIKGEGWDDVWDGIGDEWDDKPSRYFIYYVKPEK